MADGGVVQQNIVTDKIGEYGDKINNVVDITAGTVQAAAKKTGDVADNTTKQLNETVGAVAQAAVPVVIAATAGKTVLEKLKQGATSAYTAVKKAANGAENVAEDVADDVEKGAEDLAKNPVGTLKTAAVDLGEDLVTGAETVGAETLVVAETAGPVVLDTAVVLSPVGLGRISKKYILNIIILLLILVIFYIIYCIYELNSRGKSALAHIKNRFIIS
jgi:hypothetical protein